MPKYRRTYTVDFKLQMLNLIMEGQKRANICREYNLRPSTLNNWISNFQNFGSHSIMDIQSKDKVAKYLKSEIVKLREEIDIINQAIFILSRK